MVLQKHSTHEEIRESVRVKYVWVVNRWWIRMIFHRNFFVPKICCPRSIQATHTHACHSEVSIRLFGFWLPRLSVLAPCFHATETTVAAMKTCRDSLPETWAFSSVGWGCWDWVFSLRGLEGFSCPCSQNVMHGQKEICPAWWTCLSKVPIPTRSLRPLSLQKIESRHPRFGLQDIDCDLSCLIDATAASQWRIVEIHLLASAGWKRGCEPFGCRC